MPISSTDFKHGICDGFAGIGIMLIHGEVGALLIFDGQGTGLAGKQFHMVFPQIEDVGGIRRGFPHGVHAGFEVRNQNFALLVGHAVKVVCPVLNSCNSE